MVFDGKVCLLISTTPKMFSQLPFLSLTFLMSTMYYPCQWDYYTGEAGVTG